MKSSLKVFSKKSLKSVIPNRFTKMPPCALLDLNVALVLQERMTAFT